MGEKIPYHDGNDGINLGKIEIKRIPKNNSIKRDLDLMKIVLKNNIIAELNHNIPEIQKIFIEKEILNQNGNDYYINTDKLSELDYNNLLKYKNQIISLFENKIMNNVIFSDKEKDEIFTDIDQVITIIGEVEKGYNNYYENKKNQN